MSCGNGCCCGPGGRFGCRRHASSPRHADTPRSLHELPAHGPPGAPDSENVTSFCGYQETLAAGSTSVPTGGCSRGLSFGQAGIFIRFSTSENRSAAFSPSFGVKIRFHAQF